jgi:hypothetical protein
MGVIALRQHSSMMPGLGWMAGRVDVDRDSAEHVRQVESLGGRFCTVDQVVGGALAMVEGEESLPKRIRLYEE